jgi:hypothetical protein
MTVLELKKPVEQRRGVLLVENKLAPGRHLFTLVVVNDRGVASDPTTLVVTVGRGIGRPPSGRTPPDLPHFVRIDAPAGGERGPRLQPDAPGAPPRRRPKQGPSR